MREVAPTAVRAVHLFVQGGELRTSDGRSCKVGMAPVIVGRDPSCALVLDDPSVSATHCELRADAKGVRLRDLDSRNGTFVAGLQVENVLLTRACTLEVGACEVTFEPHARESISLSEEEGFGAIVGASPRMRQIYSVLREVAPTDLSVLVTGETGTGKELVAQAIHAASTRAQGPFVVVDCTSIPATLAESFLFGHEKGAFTGATERRAGAFQEAHGGTVFIDELSELPQAVQPKLLRVLAERKVKRVGGSKYEPVDVRVVAAAREDLVRTMNRGLFRSDLYFRLAQVRLDLPPLRERREDIPQIVRAICERVKQPGRYAEMVHLVESVLAQHDWPGNVRELVNVVTVAAALPAGANALLSMLPLENRTEAREAASSLFAQAKREAISAFERRFWSDLRAATQGNVSEMARRAGLERHHVRAYLRKYDLL